MLKMLMFTETTSTNSLVISRYTSVLSSEQFNEIISWKIFYFYRIYMNLHKRW